MKHFISTFRISQLILACSIFVLFDSKAQKQISSNNHAWTVVNFKVKLNDKWAIPLEYQWRRHNFYEDWQQSLLRIGAEYTLPSKISITGGYGWIRTYEYGDQPIAHDFNEHRIWEQVAFTNKFPRFELNHRYRLEQRFLENWILNSNTGNYEKSDGLFRQRLRYRAMLNIPLNKKEMGDKTLFLNLNNEVFLGFGKGIGKNILDQNRAIFALAWQQNNALQVHLGYLNQYAIKSDGVKIERNHTLWVQFNYTLKMKK